MNPRLEKLFSTLTNEPMDAVALNPGKSLTYMTGLQFHLMERPVVMFFTPGQPPALVLPELETLKAKQIPYPVQVFTYGEDPSTWNSVFAQASGALGLDGKRIGMEPRAMRLLEFGYIQAGAPRAVIVDASTAMAALRVCKQPDEVERMRRAVVIAQDALLATLPGVKAGVQEKDIAAELTMQLLRFGSDLEMPFAPIVSGGPNSANPHASPGERRLQPGDLLVIDWGASWEGYISDLTRTFAIAQVDAEYAKIHKIVQDANAAGRAAGRPGVPCAEVDRAARAVIEKAGYGSYFTHRTGHGIGMEGHEDPYMRGDNLQILEPGMAYTVEPGIYLPDRNGVRIEDNMVVTTDGAECLSTLPREMQVLG